MSGTAAAWADSRGMAEAICIAADMGESDSVASWAVFSPNWASFGTVWLERFLCALS